METPAPHLTPTLRPAAPDFNTAITEVLPIVPATPERPNLLQRTVGKIGEIASKGFGVASEVAQKGYGAAAEAGKKAYGFAASMAREGYVRLGMAQAGVGPEAEHDVNSGLRGKLRFLGGAALGATVAGLTIANARRGIDAGVSHVPFMAEAASGISAMDRQEQSGWAVGLGGVALAGLTAFTVNRWRAAGKAGHQEKMDQIRRDAEIYQRGATLLANMKQRTRMSFSATGTPQTIGSGGNRIPEPYIQHYTDEHGVQQSRLVAPDPNAFLLYLPSAKPPDTDATRAQKAQVQRMRETAAAGPSRARRAFRRLRVVPQPPHHRPRPERVVLPSDPDYEE